MASYTLTPEDLALVAQARAAFRTDPIYLVNVLTRGRKAQVSRQRALWRARERDRARRLARELPAPTDVAQDV